MLYVLHLIGAAVFAASGALAAGRKQMDLLGVVTIATVTALGGGTIRDVLLDRHPIFWIADPTFLLVSIVTGLATLIYGRFRRPPDNALAIADALGLALFTVGGVEIAEQAGASAVIAVLMGTITGVAGGMIRDVLSAEIPLILRKGEIYATAAITGASLYPLLELAGVQQPYAGLAAMAVVAALRLGAILRKWHLPVFEIRDDK